MSIRDGWPGGRASIFRVGEGSGVASGHLQAAEPRQHSMGIRRGEPSGCGTTLIVGIRNSAVGG